MKQEINLKRFNNSYNLTKDKLSDTEKKELENKNFENKELYDLTNPQKSIWLTEQFFSGSAVNTICGTTIVHEIIDFDKLKQAINTFVKDNDSFRIRLVKTSLGNIKQYISDFCEFDIDIVQITDDNDLLKLESQMAQITFDFIDCPLYSFKIFKFENGHGGFITAAHHLISDACTAGLLASKTINIYSSLVQGQPSTETPTSYINYINSEKDYITSDKFEKDKQYWESAFETVPEIGTIPSIQSVNSNSYSAARKNFVMSKDIIESINMFCKNNKISIFNFFMAVYAIYVSKVSNLNDFVLGTPILNRTTFVEKSTPGMFISTVPFRFKIDDALSFVDFVKSIAVDTLSMFRHQKYPYQNILEYIRSKNSAQPNLYDILISYQNTRTNKNSADVPYEVRWTFNNNVADSIQIHLFDMNDEGLLNIAYDYRLNKYDEKDIRNVHSRICYIIAQILNNSENLLVKDVSITPPNEKSLILTNFNDTYRDYDFANNILEIIEDEANIHPDNIAVETISSSITYEELITRVSKLSNYLLKNNLKPHSNIGILTNRTIDTIVGILAILKMGSTYVPIDPMYPESRISYMLDTSELTYILSDTDEFDSKIPDKITKLNINYNSYINESSLFTLATNYDMNDNLYIVFTSGSTGKPKGVTISHKNMMNLMFFEKYETTIFSKEFNKILQFATMSFDVSYQEIFSALLFGNTLVLIDDDKRKDMNVLSNYIVDKKINILFIPPAYLNILTEDSTVRERLKSTLDNIITAGEALIINDNIKDLLDSGITLHNHYGPAETHVATTYSITNRNVIKVPPVGKPISNSKIYILDKTEQLCPIGVIGQLAIAGSCVGNGYFNKPELTSQKFVFNKFLNELTYLTGDLGYYDSDGNVHFLGRADFQVKINGFRIELDEIDKTIASHSLVKSSKSLIYEANSKKYIISYYVTDSNLSADELRNYVKNFLPYYMLPAKFIKLDKLPINHNGKIDRTKLPPVNFEDVPLEMLEPTTNTEIQLSDIWKELFHISSVGTNYNFFNIGGDSLLAIKLSSQISSTFNVNITVGDIFDNPTISKLSTLIDKKQLNINPIIHYLDVLDCYPVSSAQKRIFYSSKMAGENSTVYNMPGCVVFDEAPDIDILNDCFNKLIARHTSLRTYFYMKDGNLVQKIVDIADFSIEKVCKKEVSFSNIDSIFNEFILPFDLSKAPLLRCFAIELKDKYVLLFDMHHIIADGLSLAILTKELCRLYNNEKLQPLKFNYIDYSIYENKNFENNFYEDSKQFWANQFKDDIPVLELPTDKPRPATKSFEGKKIFMKTTISLTNKIEKFAKEKNVSNFMIMLACYYITLANYSHQEDIVVGTPVVGRDKSEFFDVVGMFVNTLPLRNKLSYSMTFTEFVNNIKKNSVEAFNNQMYPLDALVNDLSVSYDASRNPLFDVLFVYQNNGREPICFNGLNAEYYIPDSNISKFDLSLEVVPDGKKFKLIFEFCTKLFDTSTIEDFAKHYINVLEQAVEKPEIQLKNISMLSEKENSIILNNFNNTYLEYDKQKTLCNFIEDQCAKTPNYTAVVFGDKQLTYEEFNKKANQLARKMLDLGINRDSIVGIMLPRSLEVLVCMYAVWKLGACYIPIDIKFPKNRIDYMLNNSKADLLLSFENTLDYNNFLNVSLENDTVYSGDDSNLNISANPENPSYIIYTSGSTGTPKGVVLNYKALANLTCYLNNYVDFLKNSYGNMAVASITTISFDIFIFETLICLQKGLKVVMSNEEEQVTASLLDKLIEKNDIKAIQMTPSRMQIFVDNKEVMPHLNNLKYITLAGEALPDNLLADILKIGDITVYNGYGPSETTVFSTFTDVTNYKKVNIGKPLANTQIYILDKNLNICPVGIPGELYIAGDGVGIGYANNETLTNERFLPNKFNTSPKYYKTGDLGKYLPNGEIAYIGRSDNQIKIRGLRIELDEIEKWILKFPDISKAIVTAKQDENGRSFLIAYLVITNRIVITNLRSYLSNYLPRYMVPSYFVVLDKLPYLPNGKIDKKSLPLPNLSVFNKQSNYLPPRNEMEQQIASLLEQILGVTSVSITDNFFDLGGDSLLAMNLQIELMKISNNITYSDIFMYPTVEELAKKINTYIVSSYSDFSDNDFSNISEILENNCNMPSKVKKQPLGNILITGVTGFLGSHILDEYLTAHPSGKVYCIIRSEVGLTQEKKLLDKLHFYFGEKYDSLVGKQIIIVNGDIIKPFFGLNSLEAQTISDDISYVINCAAKVSHYGNYKTFKEINVDGVQNVIDFCIKYNKPLGHVSTTSVSGNAFATGSFLEQDFDKEVTFRENNLYIHQSLSNVYVRSKFEAEKLVLQACLSGLDGRILRIGNLMPRFSDGKFQYNASENAYMNRLLTFAKLKFIPDTLLDGYAEFTPVDYCARAIIKTMEHPSKQNKIFHLFNSNHVSVKTLLDIFNTISHIDVVSDEEFKKRITSLLNKPDSNDILSGILSDLNTNKSLVYTSKIKIDAEFSTNYLKKCGFNWPLITSHYLLKFLKELFKEV